MSNALDKRVQMVIKMLTKLRKIIEHSENLNKNALKT